MKISHNQSSYNHDNWYVNYGFECLDIKKFIPLKHKHPDRPYRKINS